MAAVNRKALVGKLNPLCHRALDAAVGLCVQRTNRTVELEHWLFKLLEADDSDFLRILKHYDLDPARVTKELTRSLDGLHTGNDRKPDLSPDLFDAMREAWALTSLEYNAPRIRSGFLLVALVTDRYLASHLRGSAPSLEKILPDQLQKEVRSIIEGSPEDADERAAKAEALAAGEPGKSLPGSKTPALDQFTLNLTDRAKQGKIDPVIGRDFEIRQVIDILTRRRQNNPILVGEAGVGKTAVVEGFALRISDGDVPPPLQKVEVHVLDLALLQAGAGVKGEFENRLKGLINEVKSCPTPIILFIDEAHTMIGAGGQAGQNDAANLLKPALARGELRTIAATTWSEYKKYFEKDPALARRFQVVKVEEPTETQCMVMMRGIVGALEKHHNVRILDEGLAAAVKLSHRYLAGRQLPDKAVSVLDTACARIALGQNATPPALEDLTRQIDDLNVQERILTREAAAGADHRERLETIAAQRTDVEASLTGLQERWEKETGIV